MNLRFSIVIPTFNRRDMLRQALDSVRSQRWPDIEIIIVDGGSTDGTIEEIEASHDLIVLRGPDGGVYDALNKGIACARGDVIGALNSDDGYAPGAFGAIADAFAHHPDVDSVCGTAVLLDGVNVIAVYDRDVEKALTPRSALIGASVVNARMFRRTAVSRVGPFDLAYRYTSDRDWLVRWHEAGLQTLAIPQHVYNYRQHPGSLTFTTDPARALSIRAEMLGLARRWRNDLFASRETRRIAAFLEGRCIAMLATAAAKRGDVAATMRWLFAEDDRSSLSPALAAVRSAADWIVQRSVPTA